MPGERLALYFGFGDGGHFLRAAGGWHDSGTPQRDYPGFPWDIGLLDSGLLTNGTIPDLPDGRVFWTGGGRPDFWFAFYWWDRSGDRRSNSNSGFYVRGFAIGQTAEAFAYACQQWPKVVERQTYPLVLQIDWHKREPTPPAVCEPCPCNAPVNSVGKCSLCGYEGPGPGHKCKACPTHGGTGKARG